MSPEDRIDRIERGVEGLIARLEGLPDRALYEPPAPGEWPVMSTLAHVAEMLPYWAQQASQIGQHPGAPFGRMHDDPARLGAVSEHGGDAAEVIRAALRTSLDRAIATLRALPEASWTARGAHPRRGEMSAREVVDTFMVDHVEEHAGQVDAALRALGYSPSQVP
ncbi:MAG TPA: DinB family protein [Chloroflexota bacterium]